MDRTTIWREETLKHVDRLRLELGKLAARQQAIAEEQTKKETHIIALQEMIQHAREENPAALTLTGSLPRHQNQFKGKSVEKCLKIIANRQGGLLVMQDAQEELLAAGVISGRGKGGIYNYPGNWVKKGQAKKVRPGVYQLLTAPRRTAADYKTGEQFRTDASGAARPSGAGDQSNGAHKLEPMGISDETGKVTVSVVGRAN